MVTVGVAVGFDMIVEDKYAPLQEKLIGPLPPVAFAVSVTILPTHIGPSFVGPAVGTALTVTVVKYIVAGLQPVPMLLTVNE